MMNKTKHKLPSGIGTGYLSIMMIFVVLTLALLAALSLSAAKNEHKYSLKAAEYTADYYEADLQAKKTAVRLKTEADSFFSCTEPEFLDFLAAEEGLEYTIIPEGIEISYKTPVNERQDILTTVRLHDGVCEILSSRTVSSGAESVTDEFTLWSGDFD